MKRWFLSSPILLSVGFAANSAVKTEKAVANTGTPVERVVQLLEELKGRLAMDHKENERLWGKYACWCEATLKRKGATIVESQSVLRSYGQQILQDKGSIAILTEEVEEASGKISDIMEGIAKLTSVRKSDNEAYLAQSAELMQALAAMEKAIKVLFEATKQDSTKLLQQQSGLSESSKMVLHHVGAVVAALPISNGLESDKADAIQAFLQRTAQGYAPQSATVQGILKDMYDTFSTDLEKTTNAEAAKNAEFEAITGTKHALAAELKAEISKKKEEKAQHEVSLAAAQQTYDDTETQMKADMVFFDNTKESCTAKHEEWQQRKLDHQEEISGIEKALEILTSDDARELFAKAIKPGMSGAGAQEMSFFQLSSADRDGERSSASGKAFRVLSETARRTHSLRLATLVATLRSGAVGHFDKVIKAIDKMIGVLKEEESEDIAKRDECKDKYQDIASTSKDLDWKIQKNLAKIEELEKVIASREDEKIKTISEIDGVKSDIVMMEDKRKEENQAFLNGKAEDEGAITLLMAAKDALAKFYVKHKIPLGKIQGDVKAFIQEPAFSIDANVAPDATFSHKGSRKQEGKGIVSILTMIIEDLGNEIKISAQEESDAQKDFEGTLASAKKLQKELEEKVTNLSELIATRKQDWVDETADLKENKHDFAQQEAFKKEIKPDCDWILKAFQERNAKRTAEMDGLVSAKEFLAGAAPPEGDTLPTLVPPAMVQSHQAVIPEFLSILRRA